jgi:hypothetical protein
LSYVAQSLHPSGVNQIGDKVLFRNSFIKGDALVNNISEGKVMVGHWFSTIQEYYELAIAV